MCKSRTTSALYLAIYTALFLATYLCGYRMLIQYGLFQLLDRAALENRFWESILHLHSQPPALNILLGAALRIQDLSGIPVDSFFLVLHFLLGGIIVLCLGTLAGSLIDNRRIEVPVMVLILGDPIFYVILLDFFYTFYELFYLSLLAFFAHRFLKNPRPGDYTAVCILAVLLVYTRSLFHFAWAAGILAALPWLAKTGSVQVPGLRGRVVAAFSVSLAVLLAWPVKNYSQFGVFGYSSWQGYNLSRGLPTPLRFTVPMPVGKQMAPFVRSLVPPRYWDVPVLSNPVKSDGVSPNWNFYAVIPYSKELQAESLSVMVHDPGALLEKISHNYFHGYTVYSGRDSYLGTYDYKTKGTFSFYWLKAYEILVYQYFGASTLNGPVNGFAVTFPFIMLLTSGKIVKSWSGGYPGSRTMTFLLFSILWVFSMVLFVDGIEGNRMRFSTTPFIMISLGWLFSSRRAAGGWFSRKGGHALNQGGRRTNRKR